MSAQPAIAVNDLWFSYEVSENISTTAVVPILRDGGCSIDMPRKQHDPNKQAGYRLQLEAVSMSLPVGSRCIFLGANGAGKSTLLSVIGGRHMVDEDAAVVLGRPAFHDTSLSTRVSLLTGNWTHTVNFVGHNVPYQAMEVSRLIASHSEGVDPERVARLIKLLEVDDKWNLTTVSDGQRRRVQILCKLLKPRELLLLDEITTDLDLLARRDLLQFLREESEQRGITTVYATHIFDGLDGWPTHLCMIAGGKMIFCEPADALGHLLAIPEAKRERGWGTLFCVTQQLLLQQMPRFGELLGSPIPPPTSAAEPGPAISVRSLSWGYSGRAPALNDVSFELARGCRCLLVGANGAGKTTLLKLLGGKHMVPRGVINCLGHAAFHDTCLNTMMSLLSGDWSRQVACVGNGVPYQADFSVEFMANALCEALVRDGMDAGLVQSRLARLTQLLDLDMSWRLHKVSDGQRRRAQLLLKLLRPSGLLLLDEVTTDLDVLSRQALMQFLREESVQRHCTVVYSTHIFDGLDDWPTHILHLKEGKVAYVGPMMQIPKSTESGGSGSLYQMARGWLDEEREERQRRALAVPETPSQKDVMSAPPPEPQKPPNKFDRFGGRFGGGRHAMYA